MNSQPNFYGNTNINKVNINHEILDEISNIKPSLDAMYNIKRSIFRRFSETTYGKFIRQNVDGQYSPITEQVNALNSEPKLIILLLLVKLIMKN